MKLDLLLPAILLASKLYNICSEPQKSQKLDFLLNINYLILYSELGILPGSFRLVATLFFLHYTGLLIFQR